MSWYQKNKKWFLPTVIVGPILLISLLTVGFLSLVFGLMKNSTLYQKSLTRCKANSEVVAHLGRPIEESFFVRGNISTTNGSGSGDIVYSLEGPNGEVYVHTSGKCFLGVWVINELEVKLMGKEKIIDLTPSK